MSLLFDSSFELSLAREVKVVPSVVIPKAAVLRNSFLFIYFDLLLISNIPINQFRNTVKLTILALIITNQQFNNSTN